MEVVINKCFGGFSLSRAAFLRLRELGNALALAEDDPLSAGYVERVVARDGERWGHDNSRKSAEATVRMFQLGRGEMYLSDIPRDDPHLVQVVREMGDKASGGCARLGIVEIPDGVEWKIEEYDGNEHVAEVHRTWG